MRQRIPLNFDWQFTPDFKSEYINQTILPNSQSIMIPHTMKEVPFHYFDEEDYQFIGTYNRILSFDESMLEHTLMLEFGAVMNIAKVYFNGELQQIHEGGYTPFFVDITQKAKPGDNLLQVVVDSTEIDNVPPFGHLIDYLAFSGIYREVYLQVLPKTHMKSIHASTEEAPSLRPEEMALALHVKIANESKKEYQIRIHLYFEEIEVLDVLFEETITEENFYSALVEKVQRWNLDDPILYRLKVELVSGKDVIDIYETHIGFRTAVFTPEGFSLNGNKIKLIGLNRHQSYPYVGYAMPKSMQVLDADLLKEYGCNIVRTSHYMQSEHFVRRCDEIGLLVLEEVPGWQYIGDEHFQELTMQNIEAMIEAHFNHPSIVTWGVRINESKDSHEFYQKTNELARKLDPTRQTSGVRNTKKGDFLEDIYTYNDFVHSGYNVGLESPNKVTKGYIPYLVTEHNGHMFPTKKFDQEERRVEHAIRHLNVIDSAFAYKRISGAIGWCLADYNTHIQFGSNDRICYHGVMDSFRIPKYAAYSYQSQLSEEPMLYVASNMIPGDHSEFKLQEVVVLTNCDYMKLYKNDQYVGEYYPNTDIYPNLPHPPIIIDDFIGELIIREGKYPNKLAKTLSHLLTSYNLHGFDMPLRDKIQMGWLLLTKKITYEDVFQPFEDFVAMQTNAPVVFRFDGYIDDELVVSTKRGHSKHSEIKASLNTDELIHGPTFDVARVIVKREIDSGSEATYSNQAIEIKTSSELELIGPKNLALIGGSIGFYVKTTEKTGKATITIKPAGENEIRLTINIKKGISDN
ncbi:MAG: glycoside hydrolase family 2 protein [Bacilli bacterium]|nr:glycoside hydrolase family 2 protein [Bacilli bacterium]MBN2876055.1 glycoside hydrolase family 2 protein [Bacilli bacterium]